MSFLSWLFGSKESKPTKEELDTAEEVEELIEDVAESDLDLSSLDNVLVDPFGNSFSYLSEFADNGSVSLSIILDGNKGTRKYSKNFADVKALNTYAEKVSGRLKNYFSQGKSLYQVMGYLNLSRLS